MRQRRFFLFLVISSAILTTILHTIIQNYWIWSRLRRKIYSPDLVPKNISFSHIENLPSIYFAGKSFPHNFNKTCANVPKLHQVMFTNDHWQTQETSNGTFYLLGAYLDDRRPQWVLRILGSFDQVYPNQSFYCQIWSKDRESIDIVKVDQFMRMILKEWWPYNEAELFQPYVISCALPENSVPMSVSLVEFPCDNATNNLRVDFEKVEENETKNFVVCVKGLNFLNQDISVKLVEWIELLFVLGKPQNNLDSFVESRISGADKIVFYTFKNHPQVEQVLYYYSSRQKIDIVPLTLIGGASNSPLLQRKYLKEQETQRRLQEVLSYNDCFYKNFKKYKFAVLLDIDEVIVPSQGKKWSDLVDKLQKDYPGKASYFAQNTYFWSHLEPQEQFKQQQIPKYAHMLRHIKRSKKFSNIGYFVKGFLKTSQIVSMHNHYPTHCLDEPDEDHCDVLDFDVSEGYLHHYKNNCSFPEESCKDMKTDLVEDKNLWNYLDELVPKFEKAVMDLNLLDYTYD